MISLALSLACSGSTSTSLKSEPAPPVAAFEQPAPEPPKIVVTVVTQLFEASKVGPPKVLAGITPGVSRERAREVLASADPTGHEPLASTRDGRFVDSVLHVVDPPIRLIAISTDNRVTEVQVAMPYEEATLALGNLWGTPLPGEANEEGKLSFVWEGEDWTARLVPLAFDKEVATTVAGRGMLVLQPKTP